MMELMLRKEKGLLRLLSLFTASKLALILFLAAISGWSLETAFMKWDASRYINIALHGYSSPDDYAFAPLFPLIIKLVNTIIGIPWLSAALVSNAFSYVALLIFYRLYGEKTTLILAFFPTFLIYTLLPYSEPVTISFLALALYFSRKKENNVASMLSLSMAILSSYATAIVFPAFFMLKRKKYLLIPLITGIAILIFFQMETGDPFYYFYAEGKYWGSDLTSPWGQIQWILHGWFTSQYWGVGPITLPPAYWLVRNILFEAFFIFSLIPLVTRKMKLELVFSLLVIAQLLCIKGIPAISVPRLLLKALPAFYGSSILIGSKVRVYVSVSLATSFLVALLHVFSFFA